MGAAVAMERSVEFRLLGFYTLWLYTMYDCVSVLLLPVKQFRLNWFRLVNGNSCPYLDIHYTTSATIIIYSL